MPGRTERKSLPLLISWRRLEEGCKFDDVIEGWGETAVLFTLLGLEDRYEKLVTEIFDNDLKAENPINREVRYTKL